VRASDQGWKSQTTDFDALTDKLVGERISSAPIFESTPVLQHKVLVPVLLLDPTSTPIPTSTPVIPEEPSWLEYLNRFRTEAHIERLGENEVWSNGGWLHSRYMVKNDYVGHSEDPGNPWYTPEGLAAAQNGNIFVTSRIDTTDELPIDFWMIAPFHAISILDPQLSSTGYGIYHESVGLWKTGATLDVLRGLGPLPPGTAYPIAFPADGGETWLKAYTGGEFPDPLTSCPGYSEPTGPPIMLQLGSGGLTPNVTSHTLSDGNNQLESCLFDETNYYNPNPDLQNTGRIVLNNRDAIVIMPRQPLITGEVYTVSISTNDSTITWSFSVIASPLRSEPANLAQFLIMPSILPD
jgi:hypothetical protein